MDYAVNTAIATLCTTYLLKKIMCDNSLYGPIHSVVLLLLSNIALISLPKIDLNVGYLNLICCVLLVILIIFVIFKMYKKMINSYEEIDIMQYSIVNDFLQYRTILINNGKFHEINKYFTIQEEDILLESLITPSKNISISFKDDCFGVTGKIMYYEKTKKIEKNSKTQNVDCAYNSGRMEYGMKIPYDNYDGTHTKNEIIEITKPCVHIKIQTNNKIQIKDYVSHIKKYMLDHNKNSQETIFVQLDMNFSNSTIVPQLVDRNKYFDDFFHQNIRRY